MYGLTGPDITSDQYYPVAPTGASQSFIWNIGATAGTPGGTDSEFAVHISHPDLLDTTGTLSSLNSPAGATSTSPAVYPKFVHSKYFDLQASDTGGKLQLPYCRTDITVTSNKYPAKLGFYTNDRYLIGSKTCGSYLYLAPSSYADILVDGTDYRAQRILDYGDENAIIIPIIYQFRMNR